MDICCKALFHSGDCPDVDISEKSFRELILMVTSGVEFSFEDVMYRQVDGVAMGSPLGPVLANIFVGYCETLIPEGKLPPLYCRYVDDSFSCFASKSDSFVFLDVLNNLHPSLKFTCEFEECGQLPFLDVLVEKSVEGGVLTTVYRKPTFTGLYIVWDSFCAKSYKINLVRNLVDRAHRICSKSLLEAELDVLRGLFRLNGYPEYVVKKYVTLSSLQSSPISSDVRPVYVRLPWKGDSVSRDMERQVRSVVESNYHDVTVRFVYSTSRAFMVKKDVLPTTKQSHVTYLFECRRCESRYVGRTLQHLDARIRQHVPLSQLSVDQRGSRPRRGRPPKRPNSSVKEKPPDDVALRRSARLSAVTVNDVALSVYSVTSSVAKHLISNVDCRRSYSDDCFSVLSRARSFSHLKVLEAVYIPSLRPVLCVQKEYVTPLRLFVKSRIDVK